MNYLDFRAMTGGIDWGETGTLALLAALDLQAGHRVLEVGCGTAVTLVEVAARTAVTLNGLEPSPLMLRMARRRLQVTGLAEKVGLYGGDGRMLPFASNSYQRIYTTHQLDHQQAGDAAALLAQIHRVLKPGGLYVAHEAIWQPAATAAHTAAYARSRADLGLSQAAPQPWSLADWLTLMQGIGFAVVSADLLVPYQIAFPPHPPHSPQMLTRSRLLSRAYQWQPGLVRQRLMHRGKVKVHEGDAALLENRLFILRKPS